MKITDVETITLSYEFSDEEEFKWSGGSLKSWDSVLVRVLTDSEYSGIGEVLVGEMAAEAVPGMVERLKKEIIGEDPLSINYLRSRMYHGSVFWNRQGFGMAVMGAIDIALYDLAGHILNVPAYQLLGGLAHKKLRTYASAGLSDNTDALIADIHLAYEHGFRAYKMRVIDPDDIGDTVRIVREKIPADMDIIVDAVQGSAPDPWLVNTAVRVGKAIEPFKPLWYEEPCRVENIDGYVEVKSKVDLPISGGECSTTPREFKQFFDRRALDIVQPDISNLGFSGARDVAALAEAYGVTFIPHSWGTGVSVMTTFHFALATSNCPMTEYCQIPNPLREALFVDAPVPVDGYLSPPTGPGLGVRLTDEIIEKYPFRGKGGHFMPYEDKGLR